MPINFPISFEPLSTEDFGKLDYAVMAGAFATHKELGRLADEEIYQGDFAARLSQAGFKISREVPVTVSFGSFSKVYSLDLVIDERAVYELKAVARLTSEHVAQLLNYLCLVESERGKLVNFRPASIETKFVNAPLSRKHRQRFFVNEIHWKGPGVFRDLLIDLLRDWGTGLELLLYQQAIVNLLGGDERVAIVLPMTRNGISLGNQRFLLSDPQSAFRLTAFSGDFSPYKSHLERLLRHSPLAFIHWVNIDLETVTFTTIKKERT
jgi:GxxExxY protein